MIYLIRFEIKLDLDISFVITTEKNLESTFFYFYFVSEDIRCFAFVDPLLRFRRTLSISIDS